MTANTRRILTVAGAGFGLLLLLLVLVPLLFKDRIAARLQAEVDRAVAADVAWSGVEISFLRTFPNFTLGLRDLSVVGVDRFQGDTLAAMDRLRVSMDVWSVLRSLRGSGPLVVRSVRLDRPLLQATVSGDGRPNWDVFRAEPAADPGGASAGEGGDLAVQLRFFEVVDGRVSFRNEPSGLFVSLEGLQHTLSGDFSRERLTAETRARAERATLVFAGTPYLAGVRFGLDADIDVDVPGRRVTMGDNELRLNDLALRLSGSVARVEDDLDLDLAFAAPTTDFRQILSMIPAIYAQDFGSLQTTGRFAADGHVRGRYGPDAFPSFAVRAEVEDGSFRYPDLPLPAREIHADLRVENPGGDADSTVVRLSRLHVEIGGQPIDASATVRTPVSDPDVDARVLGTLDLEALARTVKMPDIDELSGVVTADAAMRARMSDLDSARYDRVVAQGTVTARGVVLRSEDLRQPVAVEELVISLAPERAQLETFRAELGSSDFSATGGIENLLGFIMRDEPLRGAGTFHSDRFLLDEWRSEDELQAIAVPAMLDLTLDGTIDHLTFGELDMRQARGRFQVRDERLTMDDLAFSTLGGSVAMDGYYETLDLAQPRFAFDLRVDSVDVQQAARTFVTVGTFAPVARYAQGTFSSQLALSGALTPDLTPVLNLLDGQGSLLTSQISIQDFPLLDRLAGLIRVPGIGHPTLSAIRSSVRIENGRLHVAPFDVGLAGLSMRVEGSNGIDQSLDYRLQLAVPRALMGTAADQVIQDLAARVGRAGVSVSPGETVPIGVRVAGTVMDPSLDVGLGDVAEGARSALEAAAGAAVESRVEDVRERVDEAQEEARRRAQARADTLVADAERRAESIRAEGRRLADQVRAEGNRGAEEVLAQASNPIARAAAQPVADRIRREAEERAVQIEREADARADALVAEAREQAARIVGGDGGG